MLRFVNLTSHDVNIHYTDADGKPQELVVTPIGPACRVTVAHMPSGDIEGIPVVANRYGKVIGLPDPKPDTVYIVSLMVRLVLGETRPDVVAPDTSPIGKVISRRGRVVGVRRLIGTCDTTTASAA